MKRKEKMQTLLERMLQKGLEESCYPGAVAACGDAREVWAVAWTGSLAQGGPAVDRQTRYDMASLTKILGPTMLALRALEQGELTLYDTVGMYFPEAPED
ncbi:MAG: serine hydrolase domain-containing protein, partial [Eubacteriales bacterium]|nr:serine hydrolase domain-containing protein [Eubacteriales bacterium]